MGQGTGHKLKLKHEEKNSSISILWVLYDYSTPKPPQYSFKKLARNIGKIIVYQK